MEEKQTAVEWLYDQIPLEWTIKGSAKKIFEQAKAIERENASTFGIRVTSECCSLKNGKMEVDLHKFETLLNEMYGE